MPSTVGRLRTALAELLLDENDLTAALPLAADGLAATSEFGNAPPLVLLASLPLVRLHLAQGDAAAAEAVLAGLRPLVQSGPFAMVTQLLEAAEARLRLARGDGAAAVSWAAAVAWAAPELVSLWNRLIGHFPSGEIVFNSYTHIAIWLARHAPGTKTVADLVKFPGMDDPREPEGWNPRLQLVREIALSREPEVAEFPPGWRHYHRLAAHSTALSRMGTIVLHYRF